MADANIVVDGVTQASQGDVTWIIELLRNLVDFIFGILGLIQEGAIALVMATGYNEFQSKVLITVIILGFTAWKAGSLAELVDKARWLILIILLLLALGVIFGVIV